MAKVAVIWEELTTTTLLTEMSGLEGATVAPARKLEPLMVTGTELPRTPLDGVRDVMAGSGEVTPKATGALDPPGVRRFRAALPGAAFAATLNVAVTCVALTTVTLEIAISGPAFSTRLWFRSAPVIVTGTLVPAGR